MSANDLETRKVKALEDIACYLYRICDLYNSSGENPMNHSLEGIANNIDSLSDTIEKHLEEIIDCFRC